jgi:large subunit ribosomal protein L25
MDTITMEKRSEGVKAKHLRRAGIVPCCVYGGELPGSLSIQMDQKTAGKLLREKRVGSKVQLKVGEQLIVTQIKEYTKCFASSGIEHISFQALDAGQKVNSVTHILLKNADTVTGVLEKLLLEIPYASYPKDMLDTVTVDLEGMPVGTVLTVGDIPEFGSGQIELQVEADSIVLRINDRRRATTPAASE